MSCGTGGQQVMTFAKSSNFGFLWYKVICFRLDLRRAEMYVIGHS